MDYLSRLYEREIKDFFEVAKIKMTGTTKESKKFGKPSVGSVSAFEVVLLNGNSKALARQEKTQ